MEAYDIPEAAQVSEVVGEVTAAFLGDRAYPASIDREDFDERSWTGLVTVTGPWMGSIEVVATPEFARKAAAIVFGVPEADVPEEWARDALAELTNVVGGNLKSLVASELGGHCDLSLPIVARSSLEMPGTRLIHRLGFGALGEHLWVRVRWAPPSRRAPPFDRGSLS